MKYIYNFFVITIVSFTLNSCNEKPEVLLENCFDENFFSEYNSRSFYMGFSSWAYAKNNVAVDDTYQFLAENTDIYSEQIDNKIPWSAWINNSELPIEFVDEISAKVARRIEEKKLTLSISLLNSDRNDLALDFDGTVPDYTNFNDVEIEDAYFKHVEYLINQFEPDYLVIAIEVNELLINAPEKWEAYKLLIANVKVRINQNFPLLSTSESITLHNLYNLDMLNPETYINEIVNYANQMDFVAISFYPFFCGLSTKQDFQNAFDFLHTKINKPIAFSETGHLSEDLTIDSYNLFIAGNPCEQNRYLESLCSNAQEQNYKYIIWWTHRDYNELWETFPIEVQDLGKLWISTGIVNEDGMEKQAFSTWELVVNK